jgi:hypothetical protein
MGRTQFTLAVLAVLAATTIGIARQEADPTKDYPVTPEVGTWMVCAASYMGDDAPKLAHALVLELRGQYDLPAFVFNHGDAERRQMREELDRKRRQQEEALRQQGLQPGVPLPPRSVRIQEQCAVLIGGYKDMDAARNALEKIKKLPNPKSVPVDQLILTSTTPGGQAQRRDANIFVFSFVTRNPTMPAEKVERGLDANVLKQLNSDESYSLLKCKQPWTLAVKEFSGGVAIQPAKTPTLMEKVFGKSEEHMSAIAKQAHELARVLKQMGFDAYVLHTTTSSIVTVGAYAESDDEKLHQAQKQLRNMQFGWIQLASNPLPMPVPRP